ncbi:hypothetical protein HYV73_01935 [Candidatus Uhrbacteria bacterium]|nr:hypothetical protein [Candidatus Uhrbacteria bacterium]
MAVLKEYRCTGCTKLLFKGIIIEGTVELKCKQCHAMNTIHRSDLEEFICLIAPCPHRVSVPSSTKPS